MKTPYIAVVDSNTVLLNERVFHLSALACTTLAFADCVAFEHALRSHPTCSVVLIDLESSGECDFLFTRRLRQSSKSLAIVLLGQRNDWSTRLEALREGADNYLTKPVEIDELVAVVKFHLLRAESALATRDNWLLDEIHMTLTSPLGKKIDLTLSEVELVRTLAQREDHFADRDALIKSIGKNPDFYNPRALEMMLSRLRRKLGNPSPLRAVRTRGYIFAADLQFSETSVCT